VEVRSSLSSSAARRPRVSVYIPTRNRAGYLAQCISAILRQTLEDFELIVSDNASTDNTTEIVAGFDDARLRYYRLPEDIGLMANFNRCVGLARAPYLVCTADDEQLYPDHLQRCVEVLEAHPDVGIVHTAFDIVGPAGEIVAAGVDWTGGPKEDRIESGEEFVLAALASWSRVAASTAVMRTAALPDPLFAYDDYPPADFGLWLKMCLEWHIAFVATPLAAYRIHRGTHSAVHGTYTPGGYIDTVEHLLKGEEIKLRLLDREGHRFADRRALRRAALRWTRHALVNRAARLSQPECRFLPTARVLASSVRVRPSLLIEPQAWRLLTTRALGRRTVAWLKGVRARLTEAEA
jgi:glycosyltransferase involved in cell wall biosynthesis